MTDGNSRSPPLPVSLAKTPVKEPVVVLHRQEFLNTNSSSPATSPVKKPSHPKSPASPVAMRTGVEAAEQILSPTKRGRSMKARCVAENDSTPDHEVKTRLNAGRNTPAKSPLELTIVCGVEEENLLSVSHCGRPPVVIVLEDFECFSGPLLQDLITICG